MATEYVTSNERGVSESIGFLLIFAIMITGIGLVMLYGYPLLLQQQTNADEKIMEKNMIVLQNDVKSLAYKTVPYKETSLKIGSGSLTVYDSVASILPTFDIWYNGCGGGASCESPLFKPGELRYESISAQTDISLQNGAVVMRPRLQPGSTMLAEPRWFYDTPTRTMVIGLINITSDTMMAREGIGTVRMKLEETDYDSYDAPGGTVQVTYNPNPDQDYSVAWGNYFTNTLHMTGTGPSYIMNNVDRLVIKKYVVRIEAL